MSLERVLREEAKAILAAADALDPRWEQAVEEVLACEGRVIACGLGKSGHIARKCSATLASTGTPSLFLHATEAVHGDLGMVTAKDIVLLYSFSGETAEVVSLIPAIKVIGARVMVLTGRPFSSAGRAADLALPCPVEREACPNNLAPTTSTTLMLALSDALAVAVMERRGFGSEDFARYHPAGALGRRLTLRVSDLMKKDEDLATVGPGEPLMEALRAITKTGSGAAVVVSEDGSLAGFVSDGDIRRHILANPEALQTLVQDLMTKNPSSIEPDLLAAEALEAFQMHPKAIGEMPVVAGGQVVGMIALKDLLRAGIV